MTNKRFQMKQRKVFVFIAVLQKICKISHRNYVNEEEAIACFKDLQKSLQILNFVQKFLFVQNYREEIKFLKKEKYIPRSRCRYRGTLFAMNYAEIS